MNICNKIKSFFCQEVKAPKKLNQFKCELCEVQIVITEYSMGWFAKPECVKIWNIFFPGRASFHICSKHSTADIEKFCKEKDCGAIFNGWNRWDVTRDRQ